MKKNTPTSFQRYMAIHTALLFTRFIYVFIFFHAMHISFPLREEQTIIKLISLLIGVMILLGTTIKSIISLPQLIFFFSEVSQKGLKQAAFSLGMEDTLLFLISLILFKSGPGCFSLSFLIENRQRKLSNF